MAFVTPNRIDNGMLPNKKYSTELKRNDSDSVDEKGVPIKGNPSSLKKLGNFLKMLRGYVIAFGAGLATMVGFLSFFYPNIIVTPLLALDPSRPLSMQFQVTNNGYLTTHDIKLAYAPEKSEGRITIGSYGGPPGIDESSRGSIGPQHDPGKSLSPHQSDTMNCDIGTFRIAEPIIKTAIGVVVSFRVEFIPWHQKRVYHFITQKASDGRLYWFHKPLD